MPSFHAARIRLASWYIIISALISIVFSIAIYAVVTREIRQGFIQAEQRLQGGPIARERAQMFLQEEYNYAKKAVLLRLVVLNTMIIASSGLAGYFLASKVLEPIEDMVEEQKRFIGDASHELRTPLTALRSEIEVSLRDKTLSAKAKKLLQSNLEEVQNMQNLVAALLVLSRYTDNADVTKEKVNLATSATEGIKP
jgi:signal transduction histidine kinase